MKLTDRSQFSAASPTDLIHIVVTTDTTQSPSGSSYKIPLQFVLDLVNVPTFNNYFITGSTGTYSLNVYSTPLYVATMPEALLTATGTSYTTALNNLLIQATASSQTRGDSPLQVVNK